MHKGPRQRKAGLPGHPSPQLAGDLAGQGQQGGAL